MLSGVDMLDDLHSNICILNVNIVLICAKRKLIFTIVNTNIFLFFPFVERNSQMETGQHAIQPPILPEAPSVALYVFYH